MRASFVALAACVLIAGCEHRTETATAEIISVTDDAGRSVALAHPAERIVSLMPTVTDLIVAMGFADRLIARTDYDTDARIAHLPSIGGGLTPSVEWLAAKKPDLIISWPDNGSRSLVRKLTAVGIPVYAARTDTIADTFATIKNLGVLLGAQARSDSLAHALSAALDSIRRTNADKREIRAAYVLATRPVTIAGPHTFIDELIGVAGGRNVFHDIRQLYPEVNIEELVTRDPDVIILANESMSASTDALASLPGWRELRAVRAGHVYRVSPEYFNRSGPLMPRAARELARFFDNAR